MTNEVVLNRLNELRSTIALSDPDSASAIDSLLAKGVDAPRGSGIFAVEFVSFIISLQHICPMDIIPKSARLAQCLRISCVMMQKEI